jgi:acyl dehydratase
MGMFKGRTTVFNQDDVAVMTMVSTGLIRVRNPEIASD